MITITILKTITQTDDNGAAIARAVQLAISDGTNAFMYNVGGLPTTGGLQAILDARSAELWQAAQSLGNPVDPDKFDFITTAQNMLAGAQTFLDKVDAGTVTRAEIDAQVAQLCRRVRVLIKVALRLVF